MLIFCLTDMANHLLDVESDCPFQKKTASRVTHLSLNVYLCKPKRVTIRDYETSHSQYTLHRVVSAAVCGVFSVKELLQLWLVTE